MTFSEAKRSQYGALASFYDGFLAITGFKKGMENFLDRIPFEFADGDIVLDAGTGTGLAAFYLAKRFPKIEIYASDLDLKMLKEAKAIAKKEGLNNVKFFQNDLNFPGDLYELEGGKKVSVSGEFFKAVITSGVLEHVDIKKAIPQLSTLLLPGGMFLNIGVKKNPMVSVFEIMYKFKPNSTEEIKYLCRKSGLEKIERINFQPADFPANLSRVAIIAQKSR
ncbi:hypothetical protein A3I27_03730 [Candidatus Giovannonibacteria bacterium RIFCSPLOWO2_02_FULL_43_11b]|uniref:Methyltransferase domain-containing protein n=1 Tax=Candidatus Giovannonibacteria bacterium RIFCSPHIGHO2_12_FULL_43_15 TaxID=1798341 RepID=A0A1F5WP15_9BACT|nr:MAG: hypothetical protein A2739_00910 [Candidatus Giovannonibacteria bacterium RIFCSPHIGHO2_01_FULL_43_100]OGF67339.1 MAG: hypothetical protein A3B97_03415 [Candidatus Giovannonibacteria bacterium RIFCSPHIGHO2_02_FULL_43_32]OGF77337.1 MAG: hypothetical protein A3F23_03500 [Candidatus Giovannonibacteria bacterium RIFCSPHIGHO2_12_FULL_43_15]OGF78942.1 MAG: hypothetical protein A3A15_03145 [Candidatus Giovannonibacteria bacterium RIFCSPLOWO2_01_FULL_43_60]OGF89094.1 MAG: hypothetical protein A3